MAESKTDLILLGHGSSNKADTADPVFSMAGRLRSLGLYATVSPALLRQAPFLADTLAASNAGEQRIIPVFASEGYFTEQVIPGMLGFNGDWEQQPDTLKRRVIIQNRKRLCYGRPVGSHPDIPRLLLTCAFELFGSVTPDGLHAGSILPFPAQTALILASHGTKRDSRPRETVQRHAETIRQWGCFEEVHCLFLEEEPRISLWVDLVKSRNILVIPFFMNQGPHVQWDIPTQLTGIDFSQGDNVPWKNPYLLDEKQIWLTQPIGNHPGLDRIVLQRAREFDPE